MTLTVARKKSAKRDICKVVTQVPACQALSAAPALGLQAEPTSQQYAVAFGYGLNSVRVVGQLTAPQADRVGTEVATWLAA